MKVNRPRGATLKQSIDRLNSREGFAVAVCKAISELKLPFEWSMSHWDQGYKSGHSAALVECEQAIRKLFGEEHSEHSPRHHADGPSAKSS